MVLVLSNAALSTRSRTTIAVPLVLRVDIPTQHEVHCKARLLVFVLIEITTNMATLAGIQKQIAALEKQAAAIRKTEAAAAISKAKELIARFNLSVEDLGLMAKAGKKVSVKPKSSKVKAVARPAGVAKYRDAKTGKTWTGNGKAPGWIAGAKSRDKFLINAGPVIVEPATAPAPVESKPAAKAAGKKAAPATKAVTRKTPVKKAMASKPAEAKAPAAPAKKAKKSTVKKAATLTDAAGGTAAATAAPAPGV